MNIYIGLILALLVYTAIVYEIGWRRGVRYQNGYWEAVYSRLKGVR
jgi:hypothetical protein